MSAPPPISAATTLSLASAPLAPKVAATTGSTPDFSLASSFSPIPGKLVQKIQSLQFVDMKELLQDNILVTQEDTQRPGNHRPRLREVNSILCWVSSFITYAAIVIEAHPHRTKDLLAYMNIIIRESQRSLLNGWITYDRIFRQNAATKPLQSWATLDSAIHSFCVGSGSSDVLMCSACYASDHSSDVCAVLRNAPYSSPHAMSASWHPPEPRPPPPALL